MISSIIKEFYIFQTFDIYFMLKQQRNLIDENFNVDDMSTNKINNQFLVFKIHEC